MVKKAPWIISAAVAGVLVAGGGGTAYAVSNSVDVDVYGEQMTVRTFSPTVGELLDAKGVDLESTDLVTPSLDAKVSDGIGIQVVKRYPVTVDVDGEEYELLTTGTTVGDALDEIDYKHKGAKVSPKPDTELSGEGTTVDVDTLKSVTFKGQYGKATKDVYSDTVGEAMEESLKDIDLKKDSAKPGLDAKVEDGMTVKVKRVRTEKRTETESIPFETETKKSDDLDKGTTKVETEGKNGEREKTIKDTLVDGEVTTSKTLKEKVTDKPTTQVVLEGTKEPEPEPAPEEKKQSSSEDSSKSSSSNGSDEGSKDESTKKSSGGESGGKSAPSTGGGSVWDSIAQCESGGNWSINTGNGFKGGLQFTDQTWNAFGGGAYASSADQASRDQQIAVAKKVQASQGWGAWPGCTGKLGIG
jgi:uncharacterized protein YabE (DUF348 family)